jgi:hypothetical protein
MHNTTIPWELLNRHGRRSRIAAERKRPFLDRMYQVRKQIELIGKSRRDSLEIHLNKVRARTTARREKAMQFKATLKSY